MNMTKNSSVNNLGPDFQRENETNEDDVKIVYEIISPKKSLRNSKLKSKTSKPRKKTKSSPKIETQVNVHGLSPKIEGKLTGNLNADISEINLSVDVNRNAENKDDVEILYESVKSPPKTSPQALINSIYPKIKGDVTITFGPELSSNSLSRDVHGNVENETVKHPSKTTHQFPMKVEDNLIDNLKADFKSLSSDVHENVENNQDDVEILYERRKASQKTTTKVPLKNSSLKIKGTTASPVNNLTRDVQKNEDVEIKSIKSLVNSTLKTENNANNDQVVSPNVSSPFLKNINPKKVKISLIAKKKAITKVNKWLCGELSKLEDYQSIYEITSENEDEASCEKRPKKKFPCLFCTRKFVYFTYFRKHMFKAHPEAKDILNG